MVSKKSSGKTSASTAEDASAGQSAAATTESKERKYKDNADRFRILGKKRVDHALNAIRLVGNLGGPGYEYSEAQVETIRVTLQEALDQAMGRLDKKKAPTEVYL